ncbi:hypothetical protein PG995_009795 [Apiospora arundinis]|uniref:Uncharacterized protein n=1 Tax=Apiospora arundinis TaxID=335852 RepID=A0ABR2JLY5_9PEZI
MIENWAADAANHQNSRSTDAAYSPIPPPAGYAALDFRPTVLKTGVLFAMGVVHLLVVLGLVLLLKGAGNDRAYSISITNINMYLTARYGPSVIGTVTTALVRTTVRDLQRMYPYIKMADSSPGRYGGGRASKTIAFPFWPAPLVRPDLFSMGLILASFASLQVALKADLLQIHEEQRSWRVVVNTSITYILLAMYGIQVAFFISVIKWLWSRGTGIRRGWDPTNLADTIALFSCFNVKEMDSIDPSHPGKAVDRLLRGHYFRLGYWQVTRHGTDTKTVAYGIRSLGPRHHWTVCPEEGNLRAIHRPRTPYNHHPMLHTLACAMCGLAGTICLIGCLYIAISGLSSRTFLIQNGKFKDVSGAFNLTQYNTTTGLPLVGKFPTGSTDGNGTSYSLVLWSALLRSAPLFVMGLAVGELAVYDYHHRWSQPLLNMYRGPALANKTLLLDYMTPSTLGVLTRAWEHGEWKVFYYALLNALVPLLRLLPVGILTMINIGSGIVCQFSPEFLVATIIMLTVVVASQVSAWCSRQRRFPRGGTSLLDIWLLCSRSKLVKNPEFSECGPLWTKEDLSSTIHLRHDKYQLG